MPKAIVFDFDGVIVDSEPLHYRAFLQVVERYDIYFDYDQYLQKYVGFDDRDCFRALATHWPASGLPDVNDVDAMAALCEQKTRVFGAIVAKGCQPIPGVLELIRHVKTQLPMAIASGANQADIAAVLAQLGLAENFNPIVTADDVEKSKPDPTTYRLAVEGLAQRLPTSKRVTANDCLAIEDTPAGIESAQRAGLKTMGVTTTHQPEALKNADRVITSFENLNVQQLQDWFD